jgi:predicted ATPase
MIKRLIVKNLNGKHDFDLTFHPDINIFIGKNGAGKTTLMKLIWAVLSGNIFPIIIKDNLYFSYLEVELDDNKVVELEIDKVSNTLKYNLLINNVSKHQEIYDIQKLIDGNSKIKVFFHNNTYIFFPTFRRIEGGFSLNNDNEITLELSQVLNKLAYSLQKNDIHKFILALSTNDIVELLSREYANIAKNIIDLQTKLLKEVANKTNGELKKYLEQGQIDKEILQKPFTELSQLVKDIFNKGIKITENISVGDEANAISADKLSSGEKQMLSFFAYNMFYKKAAIFIDEPEISLHTDWQKVLFPSLLAQGTENQFFVATHSPFIYAKYPDKTFNLSK